MGRGSYNMFAAASDGPGCDFSLFRFIFSIGGDTERLERDVWIHELVPESPLVLRQDGSHGQWVYQEPVHLLLFLRA